ncbi:NAD(P)-binding protein [Candidatus Palauibacter sp.]|uniref:NAD(P)-binding protein n=1 Tax=Candidatus Palauibacter sp. TaxID=3101350 RepID=UPI003B02CE4A
MRPAASFVCSAAASSGYEDVATGRERTTPRRIAIVGGGISGLGAAWALHHDRDRFDFRLFEAQDRIGGNAITADMPQDDGSSIPFDISVTACIPSVYQHILSLMRQLDIELIDTRFGLQCEIQLHQHGVFDPVDRAKFGFLCSSRTNHVSARGGGLRHGGTGFGPPIPLHVLVQRLVLP